MSRLNVTGVEDAVNVGSAVAQTIAGINDMNQRRKFEQSFALLNNKQQQELNDKLLNASNQNQRLEILSQSMVQYLIANDTQSSKNDIYFYIIGAVLAVGLLTTALIIKLKKKNGN